MNDLSLYPLSRPSPSPRGRRRGVAAGRRAAFTLIELLVAISILSLMMTLAARIFFDAQAGVQRGIQTSQIIAESRSVVQPLTNDMKNMNVFLSKYGSNNPGFLAITQQAFAGVHYPIPDDNSVEAGPATNRTWPDFLDYNNDETFNGNDVRGLRSDQIAFFRQAGGLESLTPGTDRQYDSQAKARFARIWYGHVWPEDVILASPGNDRPGGENEYELATQMVLGRQALLIVENDDATTYPGGLLGDGTGGTGVVGRVSQGTSIQAATYEAESDALELTSLGTLSVYDDGGTDPAAPAGRGLFRTPTHDALAPVNPSIYGMLWVRPAA